MTITTNIENGYVQIEGFGELKRDGKVIATLKENGEYKDYTVESGKEYTYSIGDES
jgi:hypothetical protein